MAERQKIGFNPIATERQLRRNGGGNGNGETATAERQRQNGNGMVETRHNASGRFS